MQAITTKFLPATDTKGGRIKAITESGHTLISAWDYGLGVSDNHSATAEALAKKLGWLERNTIHSGSTHGGGFCHVLVAKKGDDEKRH